MLFNLGWCRHGAPMRDFPVRGEVATEAGGRNADYEFGVVGLCLFDLLAAPVRSTICMPPR